jgi:uncharacterized protein (TIGR02246 family)
MRKTNLFATAAMLLLLASSMASAKEDSAQACWKPAFEAGDADAVANCYAPDAVLWLPGSKMMQGRDAIRAGYVDFFSAYTIKNVTLTELGKRRMGNDTATWGSFSMVLVSKADGKESPSVGRYTDVSQKIDGRWLYVLDHASDDPPAAP